MHVRVFNWAKAVILCFSLLFLAGAQLSYAQTSSGQLLQQNREYEPVPPILPEPTREPAPSELKPMVPKPGQLTFTVKQFVFVGNSKVPANELQGIVADLIGKTVTFDDLQRVTDAIAEYYRERGWLARAILPQQDITDGTVTIRIVEAKLGGIKIDNQSKRVSDQRVEKWVYSRIPKDSEISLDQLDHALLTLNDLPDVSVSSSLQTGSEPGQTILLITVADKPLLDGQVAVDNFGDSNTGKVRGSVQANVNGPLGIGDQLTVYGMYSEGNSYGRLSLTAPVGSSGLRLGVNGSTMGYRVLNQSFQSLYANGIANTGGVEANYPLIRSRPANLVSILNWNYSQFKNWTINGLNTDQTYDTSVAQFGFSGNLIDSYFGGGLSVASLIGSAGDIGRDAAGQYNGSYGVAGNFAKMRYAANRNQAITESLSVYLGVSGQLASKNMDSSEQLYLGGPMNVRAYGPGQAPASQGNLTTLELRQHMPYQTMLTAFYDMANVQTWKFNNPTANTVNNNYILQGFGASFVWTGPYNFNLKATWAQRTGQLTESVAQYLNQNGGTSPNRFWINASIPF